MPIVKTEKIFKYEVSFSFLNEDETLAYEINDLIQDRLSTFIYSEHQKEAVGTDGVETYTNVFANESRIVVVLYRENWGKTIFTRIEENAIKLRCLEESADFTVFISLDQNKPNWLSKLQLWYDIERFGLKSAAAIIEQRVKDYGGQIREETIADQVARHNREIINQNEFEKYIRSKESIEDCLKEKDNLFNIFENNIKEINTDNSIHLNFGIMKNFNNSEITTYSENIGLTFHWQQRYSDSASESKLIVFFANSKYYDKGPNSLEGILIKEEYLFFRNQARTLGWIEKSKSEEFRTSQQLVTKWQKDFLERIRNIRIEKEKRIRMQD